MDLKARLDKLTCTDGKPVPTESELMQRLEQLTGSPLKSISAEKTGFYIEQEADKDILQQFQETLNLKDLDIEYEDDRMAVPDTPLPKPLNIETPSYVDFNAVMNLVDEKDVDSDDVTRLIAQVQDELALEQEFGDPEVAKTKLTERRMSELHKKP